ncbi:hypothetical protein HAX54_014838 [Datura stramonium]|uniref:Pentatricopeptide repeat-containing protein n=1 Tax=Datura stramonium TaxID=4076 RepID=A0ABS8TPR1_DATST|nr:hypothetical protein [Datura stramonium]
MVKVVHDDVLEMGFGSDWPCNALIDMYARMNEIGRAREMFDKMPSKDVVSWNSLISGYSANGYWVEALEVFREGRLSGVAADAFTVSSVLHVGGLMEDENGRNHARCGYHFRFAAFVFLACCQKTGKRTAWLHYRAQNFELHVPVGNALIEMYSKTGSLKNAILVFEHMRIKDVVTWTAMISTYGMYGEGKKALRSFQQMKETGTIPDHIVFVAVIYACSHSGLVQDGRACFNQMRKEYNIEPRS